jgi:hypothetical protein
MPLSSPTNTEIVWRRTLHSKASSESARTPARNNRPIPARETRTHGRALRRGEELTGPWMRLRVLPRRPPSPRREHRRRPRRPPPRRRPGAECWDGAPPARGRGGAPGRAAPAGCGGRRRRTRTWWRAGLAEDGTSASSLARCAGMGAGRCRVLCCGRREKLRACPSCPKAAWPDC